MMYVVFYAFKHYYVHSRWLRAASFKADLQSLVSFLCGFVAFCG